MNDIATKLMKDDKTIKAYNNNKKNNHNNNKTRKKNH